VVNAQILLLIDLISWIRELIYFLRWVGWRILRRRGFLTMVQIPLTLLLLTQTALRPSFWTVVVWFPREDLSHSGEQHWSIFREWFVLVILTDLRVIGEHGSVSDDLYLMDGVILLFIGIVASFLHSVHIQDAQFILDVEDLTLIDLVIEWDIGLHLGSGWDIPL